MKKVILKLCTSLLYPKPDINENQLQHYFRGRWIVITGASKGIGFALAKQLMKVGANLYLVARSETELLQLCNEAKTIGCQAFYCAIDLRNRADLDQLCHDLKGLPTVDYLFCNAGKSIYRRITDATERLHDFDRTIDLNYRSMVALALALFPALQQSKGQLVYTSSVSSLYPPAPGWSAYHASKCAANIWCRTAESEWKRLGIGVHVAYLPLVRTEMSMANQNYHSLPAYSADEAAYILLRLAMNDRFSYQPWWARLTAPIALMFAPIIRFFYQKSVR
ncbi:SDR family NAD(P)-dependent oxidoreductase [Alloprevotella tannerae]|uniref:SDR family NAD(P)-dependent oxidoreductase n=1 Tax=Alloprevotella tannerae TaxID=76122 RepID=UPI0028EE76C3|nr:SDR family NAD(P)-dependent oxidoreductase [Alloprevotella tannerae]